MKTRSLLIPFIVICIGCANDANESEAYVSAADKVEVEGMLSGESENLSKLGEQEDAAELIVKLKQQLEKGDYSQIKDLLNQVQTYNSSNAPEEIAGFPQLSYDNLVDFLKSIDENYLRKNNSFEKKYAFNSAPEGYEPDTEECPDLILLSVESNSKEASLLLRNSFLVSEDIGCAESATIYLFRAENGTLRLEKVDYAG
jgi:hypothetical protein